MKKLLTKLTRFASKSKLSENNLLPLARDKDSEHCLNIPLLSELPDEELALLNDLLPWSAFLLDDNGRAFGQAHNSIKRNFPQSIPDFRTMLLDERYGLGGKSVLEVGCFEGIHTIGLAQKGAIVTAFDSRIENIVKTMVRCSAFNINANICYWNLEKQKPQYIDEYDIVHHVGVLYHLLNPIEHLEEISQCTKQTLLLDTHVSSTEKLISNNYNGFEYRYCEYGEGGRENPFSGMEEKAKWIFQEDLISYLMQLGFAEVELVESRAERNGARVLILANR